jgi:hypothetical protein
MSRAKVAIDSNFSDPPFLEFLGPQRPKMTKSSPPAKVDTSFFRAEIFSVITTTKLGCVFFLFLKNTISIRQEKQNTEDTMKNRFFSDSASFLMAAKFRRNDIWKKEKKRAPQFDRSTYKKNLSPIGPAVSEKRGENFSFSRQKSISRKTQNKVKFCFFRFVLFRFC